MRTTIRHTSLSVLVLCLCTACASAGGGQPGTRFEQNARFVQVTNERPTDFVFFLLRDSVGGQPGRVERMEGQFRIPAAPTGILPSYEVQWWPRR